MCGIVAVLRRSSASRPVDRKALLATLESAWRELEENSDPSKAALAALESIRQVDLLLKRPEGVLRLVEAPDFLASVEAAMARVEGWLEGQEKGLDRGEIELSSSQPERLNAALLSLRDVVWAVRQDRLESARAVFRLAAGQYHLGTVRALLSVHQALNALDRMEVRGRDSAGLCLFLSGHGLDLDSPLLESLLRGRSGDPLYGSGVVRSHGKPTASVLSIVYKTSAEIGELGDNVSALREAIAADELLKLALRSRAIEVSVLGHTRWASVGLISEANAHPLNEEQSPRLAGAPEVVAVLNGDVDNYSDLKASEDLRLAEEITTDAKVIPVMISNRLRQGMKLVEAFSDTVSSYSGSVAIAALAADEPHRVLLALCGSGQALYVGLGEDSYIVASEPYGVVEETSTYLRLDGETPGNRANPSGSRGQIVVVDGARAGSTEGLERLAYDGTELPVREEDLRRAAITTRDVNRGDHRHYFIKEISESPSSFLKTLRGKIHETDQGLQVDLGPETLPPKVTERLVEGSIRRILVIGQGTAAVAGQGVARAIGDSLRESQVSMEVSSLPATELSGFLLAEDMSDTLVIAISQSGTTTDTNRTVDLVRARGGHVVAIVNRRHSDLTDKADGVLYTSDGRDVEMSVASTKAFYSQIAAGFLLAFGLADLLTDRKAASRQAGLLKQLRLLPEAMRELLASSEEIEAVAIRHAPRKRYWALVGNGWNRIAAEEVRIKLSELCYKSIACDATEDKKHIDLSSEPLILVCASGLTGSTADDVAKEIAIYRAHKATPIVIATAGDQRFTAASDVIRVPAVHPSLAFVLSALAGHLFGYHAALAIDRQAVPLREIRAAVERLAHEALTSESPGDLLRLLYESTRSSAEAFLRGLNVGSYDGHLEASTAVQLSNLLHLLDGSVSLDVYGGRLGRTVTPAAAIEDLAESLTDAIDELTRPVDAIKHQAKTVTVGISRTDQTLLVVPLVRELLAAGVERDHLSYADLKTLAVLDTVVEQTSGFTRYVVSGDPASDECSIRVVETGGLSRGIPSRTHDLPTLRGTKRRVALERRLLAARGESDGRVFLLIPEVAGGRVCGLTLLHVSFVERASASLIRGVLQAYRNRYSLLRDAVTETEPTFREDLFEDSPVEDLLLRPIDELAPRWRG